MSMSRTILWVTMLISTFVITGCGKPVSVDTSKVLATVNGESISEKNREHFMSKLQRPVHPDKEKAKEIVLNEMIRRVLLAQYARDNKLDQELNVYIDLQRQQEAVLVSAAQRKVLEATPEITEEQLKTRYQREVDATHKTEYKVQHIVVGSEAEAIAIIQELKKGKNFTNLAKKKSEGPTKDKGGHLGWLQKGFVVPEFFSAMLNLRKGGYSKVPVKTEFGWHVIKLLETRAVTIPPLDKVKNSIKRLIQQELLEEKITELKGKAKIVIK